jgi:hypothetical protein
MSGGGSLICRLSALTGRVLALMVLCGLLVVGGDAIANTRRATPEDLKAGYCTPFIKARHDMFSALVKARPDERTAVELHQKYETIFNKLRRFVMARVESFDDHSLREFSAALESGEEEKRRVDALTESCIIESGGYANLRQDEAKACFKRKRVDMTKYEECERLDFLPY